MTRTRRRLVGRIALTAGVTAVLAFSGSVVAQAATTGVSATGHRVQPCFTSQLKGVLVSDGGGAAGHVQDAVELTNTGTRSCTLQGWPGVSFVGHHDGTRIGAAADQNRRTSHPTVTIAARRSLIAPLLIAQALDYPTSVCKPVAADGFRVYPPGERYSLFVEAHGMTGCASSKAHLLTVSAVRPLH
ncbi:DUF4232 domain-containing protein [Amnibacterium kyonggiense]